jgi:tetratricopeptide (TPR) repeat protein
MRVRASWILLAPVLVLLIPCFLLPALTGVWAKDKKPSEMYAEKEAKFLRAIAAKYVELAEYGKKQKLFQFAREAYTKALEFEPNNRAARKALGYVRKGRAWELDPVDARKLPEQNSRVTTMPDSVFKKICDDFEEEKKKTRAYIAKKYAGLGSWCEKQGLRYQMVKAYENAVRYDPDNATARMGLGFEKVDGKWLSKKQIQAMKDAKEGKLVNDSPSRFEDGLGIKLNKMESGHFRIETVMPVKILKEYIKACETAYALFVKDVGDELNTDLFGGKKATLIVLGNTAQWHRYVDTFSSGSAQDKAFTKKLKGSHSTQSLFAAMYEGEEGSMETTIDHLVHDATHFLAWAKWGIMQPWLGEGFAYYYTLKTLNSTKTHCTSRGDYATAFSGDKDWGQSENWKPLVKEAVVSKADPDIRMFYGLRMGQLQYNATVKSWSLITYLFDKRREDFMKWCEAVGNGGRKQEEAMKEILGMSFEEMDIAWREYVTENY